MSQKKKITNKTLVMTAIIGGLLIMAMVTANTIWVSNRSNEATNEAVSAVSSFYLDAMADRRSKTITNLINSSFDEMEKAVAYIEDEKIDSQEELRSAIGKMESLLGLRRFALVDKDNIVYTQYTTYTGRSRHAFLSEETIQSRVVNTVSLYDSSKQLCLVIPTANLSIMGRPFKACFVQLDINDIADLLANDDQGETHSAIYSKNGENLTGSELGPFISDRNLFDAIEGVVTKDVLKEHQKNFADMARGSISFTSGGVEETLCYVPILGTGWEMVTLIRGSVIQDQIRDISEENLAASRNQVIFTLVAVLLIAAVLLIEIRKISKDKLDEEKATSRTFRNMANTDALTGVRNKHAYTENEIAINQKIQAGELEKLAVVVGDIDGLKYVNDTQGHAAGDQLIKEACAMICEYFAHGAVFRVGGDEFVVILQGKGYDTMFEVIHALNRKVEENIKDKAVVISIGYSVLNKEDQQLSDVFDRADRMMYERKKELKSMGAPTSRP